MKYLEAVQAVQELMADSGIKDEGIALNQALKYINRIATGETGAHPLLQVEAASIAFALYDGEEDSEE
jgi:hypothetical protein